MTRVRAVFAFLPVLLAMPVAIAACSDDATTGTPVGADAATPDGGSTTPEAGGSDTSTAADTSTAPDTGSACNAVVNGAGIVPETAGVGAPVAAGGTIVDGTYYMTKHDVHAPGTPDSNTRKRTIVFAGNTFQTHENDPGRAEQQFTGTFTTSGTNISLMVTCPMSVTATIPYTATSTTYSTISSSGEDVFIYTKQ